MKKSISPAVAVIVIIVVLVVIFAVYKLTVGKSGQGSASKAGDKGAVAPVPEDLGSGEVKMGEEEGTGAAPLPEGMGGGATGEGG